MSTPENQLLQFERLNRWAERYSDIPSIITPSIHPAFFEGNFPEPLEQLLAKEQVWVEIHYPIDWGWKYDYPFPELRPAVQELYQRMGGQRLVWGTDMPNVERSCTYRQCLEWLRKYCNFITPSDMDRILGDNMARLFGLTPN